MQRENVTDSRAISVVETAVVGGHNAYGDYFHAPAAKIILQYVRVRVNGLACIVMLHVYIFGQGCESVQVG